MKNIKNTWLYILAGLILTAGTVSCADDIQIPDRDQDRFDNAGKTFGYIRNAASYTDRLVDLYRQDVEKVVQVGLTKAADRIVNFNLAVSPEALEEYNAANGFEFEMLPSSLVELETGTVSIAPGYFSSDEIGVTIATSASLTEGKTYVVPIRISTDYDQVELTGQQKDYFFFVTARGDKMSAEKNNGLKIISCMETGDTDPRIHCELMLKNEGKPLTDIVILFSANCNYDLETGKVYVHKNNSITPILENRDKYIKPLQDMGIKVVLSILGNHDPAGVGYMEDATNIEFLNDLKSIIEGYGLDGVMWDDEYTKANGSIPGFLGYSSKASSSHLVYNFKKMMPDKLNIVYQLGSVYGLNTVDGVLPGYYADQVLADYGVTVSSGSYSGLTPKQEFNYSWQMNYGSQYYQTTHLNKIRSTGGLMIFALGELRSNWESSQIPGLERIASLLYNDELEYSGVKYELDW